ncbi:uncharacterized protein LOC116412826 [Galleria mellonella]|uniref:Uncharacterized protein LOC116412826 n=1 Tax=Galleria mellonella TaxID=7137 RepID=A0A6J3BS43_GALME|nr:uncharacterized protein LOC116412826 [Galleria mellonella]
MFPLFSFYTVFFIFIFILACECKDLHLKEGYTFNGKHLAQEYEMEGNYNKKQRYARHVEAVTESLLEHLVKEINKYSSVKGERRNSAIPKLMRRLKMKLRRRYRKKSRKLNKHIKNSTTTRMMNVNS